MITLEIRNPGFSPIKLSRQAKDASGDWTLATPLAVIEGLGKTGVPLLPNSRLVLETASADDIVVGIENPDDRHTLKLSAQKLAKGFKVADPEHVAFAHPRRQNFMAAAPQTSANLPINANRRGFVEVLAS